VGTRAASGPSTPRSPGSVSWCLAAVRMGRVGADWEDELLRLGGKSDGELKGEGDFDGRWTASSS